MKKQLTQKQKDKIKAHSKFHQGGMSSPHIRRMIKHMKEGDSFTKAHNKAKKQYNKKKMNNKPKKKNMYRY